MAKVKLGNNNHISKLSNYLCYSLTKNTICDIDINCFVLLCLSPISVFHERDIVPICVTANLGTLLNKTLSLAGIERK